MMKEAFVEKAIKDLDKDASLQTLMDKIFTMGEEVRSLVYSTHLFTDNFLLCRVSLLEARGGTVEAKVAT